MIEADDFPGRVLFFRSGRFLSSKFYFSLVADFGRGHGDA
jgi:hypothetical protein